MGELRTIFIRRVHEIETNFHDVLSRFVRCVIRNEGTKIKGELVIWQILGNSRKR